MKIRKGFVSNSSSSSYIVAITRNFKLPDEFKEDLMTEYNDYAYDPEETITTDEIIALAVDSLCSQKTIWQEHCSASVHALVNTIVSNYDLDAKYTIMTIEQGPDEGQYINMMCDGSKEKFVKKLKNILENESEV